jgi:hypothetical protein
MKIEGGAYYTAGTCDEDMEREPPLKSEGTFVHLS